MNAYDGRDRFVESAELLLSKAQTLPNNANADSANFIDLRGKSMMGNVPVFVYFDLPAHTIAADKVLNVKVLHCDTVGGTYTEVCRKVFAATEAIAGRHMLGLVMPKRFLKLNYETTDDLDALAVTAGVRPNI